MPLSVSNSDCFKHICTKLVIVIRKDHSIAFYFIIPFWSPRMWVRLGTMFRNYLMQNRSALSISSSSKFFLIQVVLSNCESYKTDRRILNRKKMISSQGVPIRVEVGPRDLEQGTCVVARRDRWISKVWKFVFDFFGAVKFSCRAFRINHYCLM